jgi:hypothetical protein
MSVLMPTVQVLADEPLNGFAAAHYGMALKLADRNLVDGIRYMRIGAQHWEGAQDARLYYHLGEALHKLGKVDEVCSHTYDFPHDMFRRSSCTPKIKLRVRRTVVVVFW